MNLVKKLSVWQQEDLISSSQAKAIIAYESRTKKPVLTYSFLFLSVFCIGLGIVSLISANWQEIPAFVKLAADFLLLLLTAGGIYYAALRNKNMLREGFNILYAVLILASIGLIAQIYQLQPEGYRAYLLWAVLVFPIVFVCKRAALPLIWLPVFMASSVDTLTDYKWFSRLVDFFDGGFAYGFAVFSLLAYSFVYRFLDTYLKKYAGAFIYAMKVWMVINISFLVLIMDFSAGYHSMWLNYAEQDFTFSAVPVFLLLGAATVAFGKFGYKRGYSRLLTSVIASLLVFSFVYPLLPDNKDVLNFWGFLLTMTVLGWLVVYSLIKSRSKLMNLATALMALRIFVVYLQVFGSLLSTGIGLIISGVVLLLIIIVWQRVHLNKLFIIKEGEDA